MGCRVSKPWPKKKQAGATPSPSAATVTPSSSAAAAAAPGGGGSSTAISGLPAPPPPPPNNDNGNSNNKRPRPGDNGDDGDNGPTKRRRSKRSSAAGEQAAKVAVGDFLQSLDDHLNGKTVGFGWNKSSRDKALSLGISKAALEWLAGRVVRGIRVRVGQLGDPLIAELPDGSEVNVRLTGEGTSPEESTSQELASYAKRVTAIEKDIKSLREDIRNGKKVLKWCYADSEPGEVQTVEIPTVNSNTDINRTDFPTLLALAAAQNERQPASAAILREQNSYHFQAPGMKVTVDDTSNPPAISTAPIAIVEECLDGVKEFDQSDFTQWHDERANNGLDKLWDATTNDFTKPPEKALRDEPAYENAQYALEYVPNHGVLWIRLGPKQYDIQIEAMCKVYDIDPEEYYDEFEGVPAVMAANTLQNAYRNTKPHSFDKGVKILPPNDRVKYSDYWNHPVATRAAWYDQKIEEAMDAMRESLGNEDGTFLEGQHSYAASHFFNGLKTHISKRDRAKYHENSGTNNDEYATDAIVQVLAFPDMKRAECEPYCQNILGCQQSIRFKMPVIISSSLHIIYGPGDKVISGAKYIQFFDKYRPSRPKMYWLEEKSG